MMWRHCPENWDTRAWPTPEQFVDWFESACRDCRLEAAAGAIAAGMAVMDCAVRHGGAR